MNNNPKTDMDMTLDPPGSIAIVGAGTHGIEAGLYGRFSATTSQFWNVVGSETTCELRAMLIWLFSPTNAFRHSHCPP